MKAISTAYPFQVGITGGIGAGKSVVCRLFELLGVPLYVSDDRAKWLTQHDASLKERIVGLLGEEAYTTEGTYNRSYVAGRVFGDAELLSKLNALIHPAVFQDYADWLNRQRFPYVVKEAALMKAAGQGNTLDWVLLVEAPLLVRIQRIQKRDPHRSLAEIEAIIAKQASDEQRREWADGIIQNDEHSPLIRQVLAWHQRILSKVDIQAQPLL